MIVNFANADMVGHSGKIEPTVKAVETVDACLGEIEKAVRARGGAMLITADHGNAEQMIDPATGGPHTAHTTNPVPFIVVCENVQPVYPEAKRIFAGHLADYSRHAESSRTEGNDRQRSANDEDRVIAEIRQRRQARSLGQSELSNGSA